MRAVEDRARAWGADEVIFDDAEDPAGWAGGLGGVGDGDTGGDGDDGRGAAVRVIDTLREEGDVFDAILDTVGGKEVREAGERLLRSAGHPAGASNGTGTASESSSTLTSGGANHLKPKRHGMGQFTTLVGDVPERAIPSAADSFRANIRSLRGGAEDTNHSPADASGGLAGKVGYAWVSVAHDVEWEGEDINDTLGAVLRLAMEDGIRPLVGDASGGLLGKPRVVPFEKAPYLFVDNGPLSDGGTVVIKVAAA